MSKLEDKSDEELVKIICQGDQEAYSQIVERYQNKLIRYATGLIRNPDESSDVVQEAFIKAYRNLNGFDQNKKFSSWIYRITHNEAINYLKKRSNHISVDEHPWVEYQIKQDDSYAEILDHKLLKEKLAKYLDDLPIVYREPILLFYRNEKSYEEIADILHIPTMTVGTRIHRGKKLLEQMRNREK